MATKTFTGIKSALAIATLGLAAIGCAPKASGPGPARSVELAAGQAVPLVLLTKVESGIELEGTPIALMVSEDVRVDGEVAIAKGALARGKVTNSRRGDPLRMLANQPARLSIAIEDVEAIDGSRVPLRATSSSEESAELRIERSMVSQARASEALAPLVEPTDAPLRRLEAEFLSDPIRTLGEERWKDLASDLGLSATQRVLASGEAERLDRALGDLRSGRSLPAGTGLDTIMAVIEIAGLAGQVGDRLSRMLKAPNIKAHVGTPFTAYLAAPARVTLPPAKP